MKENKKPLIILSGATAVGKTEISIKLAKLIGGEIISADSMQVYKGMDIGTAKIKKHEMGGIPHYLIDELAPDEEFNVRIFKDYAKRYIEKILEKGKIPILAGGTGYYIQAVLYDVEFTDYEQGEAEELRIKTLLNEQLKSLGPEKMHERLTDIDPESAEIIHCNNTKRMLHAIEYYMLTGKKISEHNKEQSERSSPYNYIYLVLNNDRDIIYDNINRRVDKMLEEGLVNEVKKLLDKGFSRNLPSMLGLGYKEIADYLSGDCSLDEAVYLIKRDTRHFAKKQLTWFKREKDVTMINKSDYRNDDEILTEISRLLKERGII